MQSQEQMRTRLGSLALALEARLRDPEIFFGQSWLVRAALDRIADGTYGRCLECGGEIGMGRLRALPHAGFCIPCQGERNKV